MQSEEGPQDEAIWKTLHFQQFEWIEPMKVMTGPACTLRCHAVCYGMCNGVYCEPSSCNVSQ